MELKNQAKYPDWAKMPVNYDFSTKGLVIRKKMD